MADPHSAPASRRPVFGPGAWAAPSSGFGGRPASANPAARQHRAWDLGLRRRSTHKLKVFVKRRRPFKNARACLIAGAMRWRYPVVRSHQRTPALSLACDSEHRSAAVPPRARGCVSMWGSPTSRHATSARARATSNHAACASLLRWSLSLARALSPSSSRPSRRAAPQLAGTLLYRLLY